MRVDDAHREFVSAAQRWFAGDRPGRRSAPDDARMIVPLAS
ncbi:MAG: hypothetical protein ACRCYX_11885 [Dermatophilaceae bacterium]